MFLGFSFVALVCWILVAIIVFSIIGAYSPECQTDARDFSLSPERIRGRFSILRRVDSFDLNKIQGEVMLTMSGRHGIETLDRSVAGKYGIDWQKQYA